jgi:hypothetical protein
MRLCPRFSLRTLAIVVTLICADNWGQRAPLPFGDDCKVLGRLIGIRVLFAARHARIVGHPRANQKCDKEWSLTKTGKWRSPLVRLMERHRFSIVETDQDFSTKVSVVSATNRTDPISDTKPNQWRAGGR